MPLSEMLVLRMARICHSFEEPLEARNAADILGRSTAGAINEAGIVGGRIGRGDIFDDYGTPPSSVAATRPAMGFSDLFQRDQSLEQNHASISFRRSH